MNLDRDARLFASQAHRILAVFNSTDHPPAVNCCKRSHAPARSACVLHLHDRWSEFNKNLFVHSAIGGYVTRAGTILNRAAYLGPSDDPVTKLRNLQRSNPPSYWEPKWTVTSQYIAVCNQLGLSNYSNISAAIGSVGSPSQELRITRNYLAHRKTSTALAVVTELTPYGANTSLNIDQLLTSYVPGGVTLFEHWVNKLVLIAFTACD